MTDVNTAALLFGIVGIVFIAPGVVINSLRTLKRL